MIQGLRKKFILVNMLLVLMVLAVVFTAMAITGCRRAVSESEMALQMALSRGDGQRPPMLEIGKHSPESAPNAPGEFTRLPLYVVRIDEAGQASAIVAENMSISHSELAAMLEQIGQTGGTEGVLGDYNLRWAVRQHGAERRVAFVDQSTEHAAIRSTVLTAVLSLLAALLGFFVISLFLSRWALRPVERAWAQQRRFVADASHELKTPLTVILANTGILLDNPDQTVAAQRRWVENTAQEATRMKTLVSNLLFLAKSDEHKAPLTLETLDLSDLTLSTALTFESLAYEKGLDINTSGVMPGITLQGDAGQLRQLCAILLENAVKYATGGSVITVALNAQGGKVRLSVANRGAVLSPPELGRVFDRFYRGDSARASEGYGLGLAMAQGIAENHRGKITALGSGELTTFTVTLPG